MLSKIFGTTLYSFILTSVFVPEPVSVGKSQSAVTLDASELVKEPLVGGPETTKDTLFTGI